MVFFVHNLIEVPRFPFGTGTGCVRVFFCLLRKNLFPSFSPGRFWYTAAFSLLSPNSSFISPSPVSAPPALWVAVAAGAHPSCPVESAGGAASRKSCCLITDEGPPENLKKTRKDTGRTDAVHSVYSFLLLLLLFPLLIIATRDTFGVEGNICWLRPLYGSQLIYIWLPQYQCWPSVFVSLSILFKDFG